LDLSNSIVKKKYLVNGSKEDIFAKIDSFFLQTSYRSSDFIIFDQGEYLRDYLFSLENTFIHMNIDHSIYGDERKNEIDKLSKRFFKNLGNNSDDALKSLRGCEPFRIRVILEDTNLESVKILNVIYHSILYSQLSKQMIKESDVTEFMLQEAYEEGSQYLDKIFIGLLQGKEYLKRNILETNTLLITNDSYSRDITKKIKYLFSFAKNEVLIVGWIGTELLNELKLLKDREVNVKIITHKPNEAKDQPWKAEIEKAYKEIVNLFTIKNICIIPSFHTRFLVVDDSAIIGSMDLNSSSLNGTHTEIAIFTEDPDIVDKLKTEFSRNFIPLKNED